MCKVLDISRSSYYKWLNRTVPAKEVEDEELADIISDYHSRYGGILGYRRMRIFINRDYGTNFSVKRIRRIMRILNIRSSIRKVRRSCTVVNAADQKAANLLSREFEAFSPNQKWSTDVTEFKIPGSNQKLYLSAILDLYDRSVIAYVISERNDNPLVLNTLAKAIAANPDAHPMFHSDRGYQYTSPVFKTKLKEYGMVQSMSRVACCIDNGPTEALWGIIKTEMYQMYEIKDRESLVKAIKQYINFYNHKRYQERFNSKAPMEVRQEALGTDNPQRYPIPENIRIIRFKQQFLEKAA